MYGHVASKKQQLGEQWRVWRAAGRGAGIRLGSRKKKYLHDVPIMGQPWSTSASLDDVASLLPLHSLKALEHRLPVPHIHELFHVLLVDAGELRLFGTSRLFGAGFLCHTCEEGGDEDGVSKGRQTFFPWKRRSGPGEGAGGRGTYVDEGPR